MSLTSSTGRISGIELRYTLVLILAEQGRPQSVAELVAALEARGHQ